jgi:hypothetical protein
MVGAQPVCCINSIPLSKSNLKVADLTPSGLSGESGVGVTGRAFIRVNHEKKYKFRAFDLESLNVLLLMEF